MKKQTNTGLLLVFTEGKNEHSLSQGTSRVQARTLLVQLPINQFPFHFVGSAVSMAFFFSVGGEKTLAPQTHL